MLTEYPSHGRKLCRNVATMFGDGCKLCVRNSPEAPFSMRVAVSCGEPPSDTVVSTLCRIASGAFVEVAVVDENTGASGSIGANNAAASELSCELLVPAGSSACGVCESALRVMPAEIKPSTTTERTIGMALHCFKAISYDFGSRLCPRKFSSKTQSH